MVVREYINALSFITNYDTRKTKMNKKKNRRRLINEKGEIDVVVLMRIIWHRIGIIILAAFFMASLFGVLTRFFIAPTYQSGFTAFINNKSEAGTQTSVSNADTSAAESLANTYAEILRSRPMLESAAKKAMIDKSYRELNGMVSTRIQDNTQLVNVSVTAKSPEESYYLAKAISEMAPDYMSDIVEGSSMKIVAKPVKNLQKVGPSLSRNCMIGGLIGLLLSVIYAIYLEIMDTRIKSSEELEEAYGYFVVGSIPRFEEFRKE